MPISELDKLQAPYQEQVRLAELKLAAAGSLAEKILFTEELADLVDQFGLHKQSRLLYEDLAEMVIPPLDKARCWQKITKSYINQRDHASAVRTTEKALVLIRQTAIQTNEERTEYFKILVQGCFAYYFNLQYEKIDPIIKELKKQFSIITELRQQIDFYFSVILDFLQKYRWYQLPEEAVSHCQLYIHLSMQTEDIPTIVMAKTGTGFVHLWREEIAMSQKYFTECIELMGEKNFGFLMICYTYMGIGYRMLNNLSMTESWSGLCVEKAEKTGNAYYMAMAQANLAWVHARRKNWLYAEDFARKSFEGMVHKSPLTYLPVFPLLQVLRQKEATDEAGQYIFYVLHPKNKRLPEVLTGKMQAYVRDWVGEKNTDLLMQLEDILLEAKLSGYD